VHTHRLDGGTLHRHVDCRVSFVPGDTRATDLKRPSVRKSSPMRPVAPSPVHA
jgi:hypothetical protein